MPSPLHHHGLLRSRLARLSAVCGLLATGWPAHASAPFPLRPQPEQPAASPPTSSPLPPRPESGVPEQFRPLHPVRDPFVHKWQRATARSMAGPTASVWYREMSTRLDVGWRIAEMTPSPVLIDAATRDLALDMALAGVSSGWDSAMQRTLRQSTELTPLHTLARTVLTPSVQVQRARDGSARITPDSTAAVDSRAAMASIDRGPGQLGRSTRATSPTLRTGSRFSLLTTPSSEDVRAGTDADSPVAPGMSSWIDLRDLVFDAARVQARVGQPPERNRFRPNVRWTALVRQELVPSWAVIADLQGQVARATVPSSLAARKGVALEHRLDGLGLSAWAIRTGLAQELRDDLGPDVLEERLTVSLRADLGWHVPQDVDRWPLGQRPGAPGPVMPVLSPTGPGAPVPFMASPAERTGALPPLPLSVASR